LGTTPAAINNCLSVADDYDVQVMIHSDTLNDPRLCRGYRQAFQGPHHHAFSIPKAPARHAPDIIKIAGLKTCCRPRPIRRGRSPQHHRQHLDMLMVCHISIPRSPRSGVCRKRIRKETIGPKTSCTISAPLSMSLGFPSHGPAWRSHHPAPGRPPTNEEAAAARLPQDKGTMTISGQALLAKYTINPAIAHGVSKLIGSVEKGQAADLVLWSPAFFGVKPDCITRGARSWQRRCGRSQRVHSTAQPVTTSYVRGVRQS